MRSYFCRFCGRDTNYSIAHAATLTGVCRETIYRWLRRGLIHGIALPSSRVMLCVESLIKDQGAKAE
jgi:predicted site-specific integrase-resolvase